MSTPGLRLREKLEALGQRIQRAAFACQLDRRTGDPGRLRIQAGAEQGLCRESEAPGIIRVGEIGGAAPAGACQLRLTPPAVDVATPQPHQLLGGAPGSEQPDRLCGDDLGTIQVIDRSLDRVGEHERRSIRVVAGDQHGTAREDLDSALGLAQACPDPPKEMVDLGDPRRVRRRLASFCRERLRECQIPRLLRGEGGRHQSAEAR